MAPLTRRRHPGRPGDDGVTLIEVLISMVILGIVTTMLIQGWLSLQKATATVERTNTARATQRDAMARISTELRAAQPTALPTPSGTSMPSPDGVFTEATKYAATFRSAFNVPGAQEDASGLAALRLTRIWLDVSTPQAAPWNPACRTLYMQRDMNKDGDFDDAGDRTIVLGRNIANMNVPDASNATSYTPVFRYAYLDGNHIEWTDDASAMLDEIVGVRVRLIVDTKMGGTPKYVDTSTTVRLRNVVVH